MSDDKKKRAASFVAQLNAKRGAQPTAEEYVYALPDARLRAELIATLKRLAALERTKEIATYKTGDMIGERNEAQVRATKAEELVTVDPLTKAPNRAGFNARAEETFARMRPWRDPPENRRKDLGNPPFASFITIDLDGFKPINDAHGHLAGDKALQHIAAFFKNELRATDYFARTGGDEFSLILAAPENDIVIEKDGNQKAITGANTIMERLRTNFLEEGFTYNDQSLYLSFSYGTKELHPHDHELTEVIKASDAACYDEKNGTNGRISKKARMEQWYAQKGLPAPKLADWETAPTADQSHIIGP